MSTSSTSEVNLKQSLRKLDFPLSAKEALDKIGELICGPVTNIIHMDLALDLMSEFLFWELDRRGKKRQNKMTPLQELYLLGVMLEYFNSASNETIKNTVFLSLFSGTTASARSGVLNKLVSLAVGIPCEKVLVSASVWMQQLGNTSVNSCKLVESLILDYFLLAPDTLERLKDILPKTAPDFLANFMTAVGEIYFAKAKKDRKYPPKNVLEIIIYWISTEPSLCIAAQKKKPDLPPGAIAMEAITPLAGLFKFSILAPIYNEDSELYLRLHLALLNSVGEIPITLPARALCAQHLLIPIQHIQKFVYDLRRKNCTINEIVDNQDLQTCLDRLGQTVQVSLASKCVYGNIDDLLNQLKTLPYNRFLKTVIKHNTIVKIS